MGTRGRLKICQISDLLDRTIIEINDLNPTAVVVSGDLTDAGYRQEFEAAAEYVRRFQCEHLMVIPGNHDSRNVGYIRFERLSGGRYSCIGLRRDHLDHPPTWQHATLLQHNRDRGRSREGLPQVPVRGA